MSSKIKNNKVNNTTDFSLFGCISDIFIFVILCVLPLVVTDSYFNILDTKYYFYVGSAILFAVASIIIKHKSLVRRFVITDWALAAFLLIALISTVISDYFYEAFWGNEGRYSGLFLLGLYGIVYYFVSKFATLKRWYLDAFLLSAMLVCVFGITDYFRLDILGFKEYVIREQLDIFVSTMGNINTYTAFVGMVTAVVTVLFATEKKISKLVFYCICMIISFFALIMGISDNAYLSLAALLALLPLYLFGSKIGARRYLIIVASFFTVVQCIDWINSSFMGDYVVGIDSAFNLIVKFKGLPFVVLGLWLLVWGWFTLDRFEKVKKNICGNRLRLVWLFILLVVCCVIAWVVYDANMNDHAAHYGALSSYLIFNDEWGTHRGYIWRNAMECYRDFSPIKKIFGSGPDTFGIILLDKTKGNIYGEIFDAAHNEYLHYLITVGAAGLLAYLVYIGSFIVRCIRKKLSDPHVIAIVLAVICYMVQALVNLNLPIVTPIMWLFLALGMAGCREDI